MPEASKVVVTPAHAGWRRAVGPVRTDPARDALLTDFGKATLQDRYLLAGRVVPGSLRASRARVRGRHRARAASLRLHVEALVHARDADLEQRRHAARTADLVLPELGRGQPRRHRRHLDRKRLARVERRRYRHLLGRGALDRRARQRQRADLGHHPVRARDGLAHARDLAGLAAPRLRGRLPRRASPGDRGVRRDPQTLGRLQSQEPEPAPRHRDHRRVHGGRARRPAVRAAQPAHARAAARPCLRACSGRRSSRRACRRASPISSSSTRRIARCRSISASSGSACASRISAARSCCRPAAIIAASRVRRSAASRRVNFETWDEWSEEPRFIEDLLRFLDNVLEEYIATAPDEHGAREVFRRARALGGPGRDGLPLVPAGARHSVRERAREELEHEDVQASSRGGRRCVARARARARRVPRRGGARRRGALQSQARDRADREHQHHLRRHERMHRADPREHLHAQDAVGLVHGEESRAGQAVAAKGADNAETWRSILEHDGSVQHLDVLDENEKAVFKTAFEIDQRWVIDLAADRTPSICQGQSLNLYLESDTHKWDLLMLHWTAWERGIKSLYYCRSKSRAASGLRGCGRRQHAALARAAAARGRLEVRRVPRMSVRKVTTMPARNPRSARTIRPLEPSPQIELLQLPGLMKPSTSYKPFRYPWAYEFWKTPAADPLDARGGAAGRGLQGLGDQPQRRRAQPAHADLPLLHPVRRRGERQLHGALRAGLQTDRGEDDARRVLEHGDRSTSPPTRCCSRRSACPRREFAAFLDYAAMRDKHDYMQQFGVDTNADIARTLAMFGGFTEGLQLFASFAMLMNFPRHNKMKGMGQIVQLVGARREPALRGRSSSSTTPSRRRPARVTKRVRRRHRRLLRDRGRPGGPVHRPRLRARPDPGHDADDVKAYIRFIADWRLQPARAAAGLRESKENPLPWLHRDLERRRARELLRGARHRVRQGRDPRRVARAGGRVGCVRRAARAAETARALAMSRRAAPKSGPG